MRSILFGLLFILIAATVVIYFAIGMQSQAEWARDVCRFGEPVCQYDYFYWLIAFTAVVAVVFLLSRMMDP